jgi:hypothetical protein
VRLVTTVAEVYARQVAAAYRTVVDRTGLERMVVNGRVERQVRARMHEKTPYDARRISPRREREGRTCRA